MLSNKKTYYLKNYSRYKKNLLKILNKRINQNAIDKKYFSYGKRYYLAKQKASSIQHRNLLVELGSGYGETLKYLSFVCNFKKSIGVDLAYKNTHYHNNIKFIYGDLDKKFPFKTKSVDYLIAMMVFEHLFDPFHAFKELSRILSDDGIAIINLPLITSIKNRFRLLFGLMLETSVPYDLWIKNKEWDGNHLHYFTIKSIKDICLLNNLEIIDLGTVGKFKIIKDIFPSFLANEITFSVKKIIH